MLVLRVVAVGGDPRSRRVLPCPHRGAVAVTHPDKAAGLISRNRSHQLADREARRERGSRTHPPVALVPGDPRGTLVTPRMHRSHSSTPPAQGAGLMEHVRGLTGVTESPRARGHKPRPADRKPRAACT